MSNEEGNKNVEEFLESLGDEEKEEITYEEEENTLNQADPDKVTVKLIGYNEDGEEIDSYKMKKKDGFIILSQEENEEAYSFEVGTSGKWSVPSFIQAKYAINKSLESTIDSIQNGTPPSSTE